MNSRVKELFVRRHNLVLHLTSFLTASLIFLSGVGRYRTVLVYAAYCLLKSVWTFIKPGREVKYVLLPAIIFSLYLDITKGQFFPLFLSGNLVVALLAMVITDTLLRRGVERFIEHSAEGNLFVKCPSCKYDNKELVGRCVFCFYEKGHSVSVAPANLSVPLVAVGSNVKMPSNKIIRMIGVGADERILFLMKVFPFKSVFRNGKQEIMNVFVLTEDRMILLDYHYFSSSWRKRYDIAVSEILIVEGKMKRIYMAQQPSLEIKTRPGHTYEIVFRRFGGYKEKIFAIGNLIKQLNPETKVTIDLPDNPWKIRLEW